MGILNIVLDLTKQSWSFTYDAIASLDSSRNYNILYKSKFNLLV